MDRDQAVSLLRSGREGVRKWNLLRAQEPLEGPGPNLRDVDLADAQIHLDIPFGYRIQGANLRDVSFAGADLRGTDFRFADLQGADFYKADLRGANFFMSVLSNTGLGLANLAGSDFSYATILNPPLEGTDFSFVTLDHTTIYGADLSKANGLDCIRHKGPSEIGLDTLFRSKDLPLGHLNPKTHSV